MMELWDIWDEICEAVSNLWEWISLLIAGAVEFIADGISTVMDFFRNMLASIWDFVLSGLKRVYEILFPDKNTNAFTGQVRNCLENLIKEKNKTDHTKYSLSQARLVVVTDADGNIEDEKDIKLFFNSSGSSMEGLESAVKASGGIVELTA